MERWRHRPRVELVLGYWSFLSFRGALEFGFRRGSAFTHTRPQLPPRILTASEVYVVGFSGVRNAVVSLTAVASKETGTHCVCAQDTPGWNVEELAGLSRYRALS